MNRFPPQMRGIFYKGEEIMWVVVALVIFLVLVAEGIFVLSDKLPWNKKKEEKDRWWEK